MKSFLYASFGLINDNRLMVSVMRRARVLPFPALRLVHHDVRSWRSFDTAWSAISAYSGYELIDELCVMTHLPVVYY